MIISLFYVVKNLPTALPECTVRVQVPLAISPQKWTDMNGQAWNPATSRSNGRLLNNLLFVPIGEVNQSSTSPRQSLVSVTLKRECGTMCYL